MELTQESVDEPKCKTITIQTPVYCMRCYHSLCIPQCGISKSCEITESENSDESDSDDDHDSVSLSPIFREDPEDVEYQVLEEVDDWFQQNLLRIWHASVEKDVVVDISNYLFGEWLEDDYCEEYDLPEIRDLVKRVVAYYFAAEIHMPPRQGGVPIPLSPLRKLIIANKLRILDAAPSSAQKTQEWYETRYGLLTASNVWKTLGTEAQQNQLIVEKCIPFDKFKEDCARHGNLSADNPMAWGQKYEAVTAMIYEAKNGTKLGEYGCIVHSKWRFLGASPDGINVDPESDLYGRMVEIKNIVNRDIDGVPLDAYWVQMQLQMEVCDLDECDFVETRIKKFANREELLSSANPLRGLVVTFVPRIHIGAEMKQQETAFAKKQFYEYFIVESGNIDQEATLDKWVQDKRTEHSAYVMSDCEYWGVDQYSCVLVKRNRAWFDAAIPYMERIWRIIETERVTGCEHRAPKKREPKVVVPAVTVNKLAEQDDGQFRCLFFAPELDDSA